MKKKCSGCKAEKPLTEFYANKNYKDGLFYFCKECVRKQRKRFREENSEKIKKQRRGYYEANRERYKGYVKKYIDSHPEKAKEQRKKYYETHRDKIKAQVRAYHFANPEKRKKFHKKYYQDNIEKFKQHDREYYKANREKVIERTRKFHKVHPNYSREWVQKNLERRRGYEIKHKYGLTLQEYKTMLELQGHACATCNKKFTDKNKPNIDHCHKTGKTRKLLCFKCNSALGFAKENPTTLRNLANYIEEHKREFSQMTLLEKTA